MRRHAITPGPVRLRRHPCSARPRRRLTAIHHHVSVELWSRLGGGFAFRFQDPRERASGMAARRIARGASALPGRQDVRTCPAIASTDADSVPAPAAGRNVDQHRALRDDPPALGPAWWPRCADDAPWWSIRIYRDGSADPPMGGRRITSSLDGAPQRAPHPDGGSGLRAGALELVGHGAPTCVAELPGGVPFAHSAAPWC